MEYCHLPKTSGIYRIDCLANNKVYFGQACKNKTIRNRVRTHLYELKKGIHKNKYLQNAFNVYGNKMFVSNVELYCSDEQLDFYENKYLKLWGCNHNVCYNLSMDAKNPNKGKIGEKAPHYGKKHSEKTKIKISKSLKGKKCAEKTKTKISKANKGKKRSIKTKNKLSEIASSRTGNLNPFFGKTHSSSTIKKIKTINSGKNSSNYNFTKYYFVNIETGIEEYCTQHEFYKKYNFSNGGVNMLVKNKQKSYKGWTLKNHINSGLIDIGTKKNKTKTKNTIKISVDTRKKISLAAKKRGISHKTREAQKKALTGKKQTKEHIQNRVKARKNYKMSSKTKNLIGKANSKTYNIVLISPEGIEYGPITNLCQFSRKHNLSSQKLHLIISKQRFQHKGWKLKN